MGQNMMDRFQADGKRLLIEQLKEQTLVVGSENLAKELAACGELKVFEPGSTVMEQGEASNYVAFIIVGACQIVVHGRPLIMRRAGTHVGEMAAIQPTQTRSATVITAEESLLLVVSEPDFSRLAVDYSNMWRLVAKELARRLEQRNAHVAKTHQRIELFVISSKESLDLARALQNGLEHDCLVQIWTDDVFRASSYSLESLEQKLDAADFAVALATGDDRTESRKETWPSPRDNVVFELGFFMGRLGRKRAILAESRDEKVKLPSDLAGLTTVTYRWSGEPNEIAAAMGPVCNRIRDIIRDLGPHN